MSPACDGPTSLPSAKRSVANEKRRLLQYIYSRFAEYILYLFSGCFVYIQRAAVYIWPVG